MTSISILWINDLNGNIFPISFIVFYCAIFKHYNSDLNPNFAEAYNEQGNALNELKKLEEAIKSYNNAININPKYADAYYNKGLVFHELKKLESEFSIISEVRGAGLLLGIKTNSNFSNIEFSKKLRENNLLTVPAADNILRLAPPLIVKYKEIDKSILIIKKVLGNI